LQADIKIIPRPAFRADFVFFQYVKDRASRIQSESSLSGFVEALPIFERSSKALSCGVFRLSTVQI
jgi:hypothetical protein